jgi:hypothetical protein
MARRARERKEERRRKVVESLPPADCISLQGIVRRQIEMLATGLRCPRCDGGDPDAQLDVRQIRDLSSSVVSITKNLPGLMTFERSVSEVEEEAPLDPEEELEAVVSQLLRQPSIIEEVARRNPRLVEMALSRARKEA